MTIDQMIDELQLLRLNSPLGGDTVIHLCVQHVPYMPVDRLKGDFDYKEKSGVVIIESDELDQTLDNILE